MDLYDVAVARKLSSGGGGGSSDFSTAEVTVTDQRISCTFALYVDLPPEIGLPADGAITVVRSEPVEAGVANVPLYKGGALAIFTTNAGTIITSGDITELGEGTYFITGDCTITIS